MKRTIYFSSFYLTSAAILEMSAATTQACNAGDNCSVAAINATFVFNPNGFRTPSKYSRLLVFLQSDQD
jgi:hypothetical protein